MSKVLIIEDDRLVADMVRDLLVSEHHSVECVYDGADGLQLLQSPSFDLVILDIGLPSIGGMDICKTLRARGDTTPILMLTGRDTVDEIESGLNSGADDYLTKPFHIRELAARVRAMLRRSSTTASEVFNIGHVSLDSVVRLVKVAGQEVHLLPKEYSLLEFLMRHPGQLFKADALLNRVWQSEQDAAPETVRTCVARLRKKIDVAGYESILETVHGVGYRVKTLEPSKSS